MKARIWWIGLFALVAGGCGMPDIVDVYPPGVGAPPAEIPEDQRAEALGEQLQGGSLQTPLAGGIKVDANSPATKPGEQAVTQTGLKYETVQPGTGPEAKPGQTVSVHYTGTLTNGKQFDSSHDRGRPFQFVLGMGQVIRGWDEGVAGMKVGEKRKLVVPPELGYGDAAQGSIPPRSFLLFDVELLEVK
jgi:FKBP-type peptidyl-prolyl cis-trans isomerase